jgi:hypothetical protein
MDDEEILLAYNAEMQGIANYYALATGAKKGLSKLLYIAEGSCLKTLAAKHQSTVRKMAGSCPCPMRINIAGSPVARHRSKKA